MISQPFYYNTIRKVTIAFGTIFNELVIYREDANGNHIKQLPVPLQYTPKEKFVNIINQYSKIDQEGGVEETLPRMGFEMTGLLYAPERKTNTMEKIIDENNTNSKYMYNRVPYDISFSLFIATRKLDDSFRIVEQILPYFTPELQVKIIDKSDYGISTNVPFILNATNFLMEADGTFDDRRTILWQLDFTAKAYLYAATRDTGLIKKTIIDINDSQTEEFLEQYVASINPLSANPGDEFSIDEKILDSDYKEGTINNYTGTDADATLE